MDIDSLRDNLDDPVWRLSNLYQIIIKTEDDEEGLVIRFSPNRAQRRLIARLWHRNIILKARQLGFTTLVSLLWLDTALFSKDPVRCGIIAQDREAAEAIFRDKIKFAYDRLPDELRAQMPLKTENKSELVFAHNDSSIRVATSMRSGTIHRLHVSEFGKICAKYPDKAKEVVTGSIPAVPNSGILIIESTAEGQDGYFYKMCERSQALAEKGVELTSKDYRFHFYPWWENEEYEIDPGPVLISSADLEYFRRIEAEISRPLSESKRAWYVTTRESDFSGDPTLMWQEYPSTPKESFQTSTEGCYYATNLSKAREEQRILPFIPVESIPVNTFWDIGRGDATAIWVHQRVGLQNRFVRYMEDSGEDLITYVSWLQSLGLVFGTHYLPHDAAAKRMGKTPDTNQSIQEMLQELMPGQRFEIVPRVTEITSGIAATRKAFASCWFDETHCKQGIARLANYRKEWDKTRGCWKDQPRHDDNSHGSDAFRQFGQLAGSGETFSVSASKAVFRRRGSGMAV